VAARVIKAADGGAAAVPGLEKALHGSNEARAVNAAILIGSCGGDGAVKALAGVRRDKRALVRRAALEALGSVPMDEAAASLATVARACDTARQEVRR